MPYETLLYEVHRHVATITLNRPKVLNALNAQVFNELEHIFTDMDRNSAVRVLLITGAGEKAFAAGADINELALTDAYTGEHMSRRGQDVFSLIETCGKPVIALINGFALGGGCELALACTLRFASATAKLGQPEIKLGVIPGYGGTQRLPRLIGESRAFRLILTGEMISAEEALRIGLVDEVYPADQLLAQGQALATQIAAAAPLAVTGCLEAVRRGSHLHMHEALRVEAEIFGQLCETEDKAEGTARLPSKAFGQLARSLEQAAGSVGSLNPLRFSFNTYESFRLLAVPSPEFPPPARSPLDLHRDASQTAPGATQSH